MAPATVTETTPTRKPSKAFYTTFDGMAVVLFKRGETVVVMDAETGDTRPLTPAIAPFVTVLGEVGDAAVQYALDLAAGGAAAIACGRQMLEVA